MHRFIPWVFAGLTIVVVLVLLGLLFVFDKPITTRWDRVYHDMHQIQQALLQYKLKHAAFPEGLDKLSPEYFPNGVPRDAYTKEAYLYTTDGRSFSLISYGKDVAPGGEQPPDRDIVYTEAGCLTPFR